MGDMKRPAKGFDEISRVFLPSTTPDHSAEMVPQAAALPSRSPLLFPVLCCLSPAPAVESFFACNLSVEIAKNNKTVTLIDFGFERSVVRHLMGCSNPISNAVTPAGALHPDYRLESIKFDGLAEITLVLPARPRELNFPKRTLGRILTEDKVRKCNVILINSPMGPMPEIRTRFPKAILLIDDQIHSLARGYSWIKRLSSGCLCFIIGAVHREGEDSKTVMRGVSKLQNAAFKHLPVGLKLRVISMPLDMEARASMHSGKPLALRESPALSSSAGAIAKLCGSLLRNE
jgi:hypothetical protein